MQVSVIMIDGSFRESFHAVDYFCDQTLSPNEFELIWVEFYDKINPLLKNKIDRYENARIVNLNRSGIYHSSYCFNEGIRQAKADIIYIPDADVAVERDFLEKTMQDHIKNDKLVMYFFRAEEPESKHSKRYDLEYLKKSCRFSNPSNYGACISLRKKWLLDINGYEQHPIFGSGFHANGLDVYTRLKNTGLHVRWHPDSLLYHPWHPFNSAGFPVWQVQKTLINYRARNILTRAYFGIDNEKDPELPFELEEIIEKAKKEYKLNDVFDSLNNLLVDPEKVEKELFIKNYYTDCDSNKNRLRNINKYIKTVIKTIFK